MADDIVRIGVVGAGKIVRDRHVPGFRALDGVRLESVANRNRESGERAASELGFARVHAHWSDVVADPGVEAVVVGTWPYLHAPVATAALEAGKHVLIQARLAMDAAEARAIQAAAQRHPGLVTMVVPAPFTFWADACVRRLLADGTIGDLHLVRSFWNGGDGAVHGGPGWRRDRRYSGNNALQLGIAYEQLARWVGHAQWVQAAEEIIDPHGEYGPADIPDLISVLAELPGRARLNLELTPHARFAGNNEVYLFGSEGTLIVDITGQQILLRSEGHEEKVSPRPDEHGDWQVEAEFIGAIRGANEVRLNDVATAVRYMEFTDAVRRSAAEGRRVVV
ncbi:gfo/Idh/MocA family oxidoreductase [Actinobacteria bacterium YIM 96077]|uniref:Gfo/Idh/MocA family oxidoreductase n=1 Tax=Phytoactinopolyspora halophila TaxID=1981511 RepID=A0A329QJ94_9ACTN|nr:Gfo/Idh/MocA family oxidoreductase [Phytoactinopolyspora halophila]AYY12590.1 gfo/Idh/MocA family oxidoreductase [Actinobacteria bacterium YIM 96077]RAW12507.1 gfo/Idh/MocA family oxidoreductase [Phytoactinopolyspora halophila]